MGDAPALMLLYSAPWLLGQVHLEVVLAPPQPPGKRLGAGDVGRAQGAHEGGMSGRNHERAWPAVRSQATFVPLWDPVSQHTYLKAS